MYSGHIKVDGEVIAKFKDTTFEVATTSTELAIVEACNSLLNTTGAQLGISNDLFELGISSIDLLKLRLNLQNKLKIPEIPITIFFSHPIIRDLAPTLEDLQRHTYNPVVVLQPHGTKTPLVLIHPGVGEI